MKAGRFKENYYSDKKECDGPFYHIVEGIEEEALRVIDGEFVMADALSIQNAEKHRKILLALSFAGALLTIAFLLYDEAEMYGLIFACGVMLIALFGISRVSGKLECHRKYVEYRVLAESLRLQFYLRYAGLREKVTKMMPWSIRMEIPWIAEVIEEVLSEARAAETPGGETCVEAERGSLCSISDIWVGDQLAYHKRALSKTDKKDKTNKYIVRTVFIITVISYLAALAFEIKEMTDPMPIPIGASVDPANVYRAVLKIVLGALSAITIFTGSYYGKLSLDNVMEDHRRMIALYSHAESEIAERGETPEMIMELAREFLNENSTWYAYQSKNAPEVSI
ncbi:MAG: hypothetical protein IKE52_07070 [Mogibacterium sp.]|nr:hypothetical protein [Mogibacterium sp.]